MQTHETAMTPSSVDCAQTTDLRGGAGTSLSERLARISAPTTRSASADAAVRRLNELVEALPAEQRWVLANRVKRLKRFCAGVAVPTRVELATMEEVTGWALQDLAALVPPVDWGSATTSASAVTTLREALGWTRHRLAEFCDVDVSALSRIERGTTVPSPTTATRLAEAAREAGAPEDFLALLGTRMPSLEEAIVVLGRIGVDSVQPDAVVDGIGIGKWFAEAKRALEQDNAPCELRDRLAALGYTSRREQWMSRFALLQDRRTPAGGALVFSRDDALEPWVSDQRRLYASGSLSHWKQDLLEQVPGWRWGVGQQEQWMATYERVAAAARAEGLTVVKRTWITTSGFKAGDWLVRARKRAERGRRDVDVLRRDLLDELPPFA
jgi:transcriptional regulator with XRE-family HTH domain